ncbi:MAG: AsmA family protein [Hyphomicrobiaceae bacterium]
MNRVLLAIGGLLVGLLALLFVAPVIVDWNRYRGIFEEEATRFLGREVRVGGEINLRLLPTPYVQFERVRIADTMANVGKPLFMADNMTVRLSIGALLSGGIEASAVELAHPIVTLVLDEKGGGSWAGLAPNKLAPSLGGMRVAFDAIRINEGTLQILASTGRPRATFKNVNGELSAASLEGPYKIAVTYDVGGRAREFRLSTAAAGENGAVRTKATVRDPTTGLSYTVDGELHDLFGKTRLGGQLTARLPLPSVIEMPPDAKPRSTGDKASEFDVRADVAADATGLTLKNLALSFEQEGRPQLANGEVAVTWAETTEIQLSLSSQWLDLDHIAGSGKADTPPLRLLQTLANGLSRLLTTEEGRTVARVSIDQAALGKEVVSGLAATLEQVKSKLHVRGLTASLPGGTRLSADGTFDIGDATPRYDGKINLRGGSLSRFMGWASRGKPLTLTRADNTFALVGDVSLAADAISGRDITLRIGRNVLMGSASWKDGRRREVTMDLEGSELDLSVLFDGGPLTVSGIAELAANVSRPDQRDQSGAIASQSLSAIVRLHVGQLRAANELFRNAICDLKLENGQLTLTDLRLKSDEGYLLDLRGTVANLAQANAKGELTAYLAADRWAGLTAAARLLDLPAGLIGTMLTERHAASLLPARLAGRLSLGPRGNDTRDLAVDGTLGGTRLATTMRLASKGANWRDRSADVALTLDGASANRLFANLLLPAGLANTTAARTTTPTAVSIRAVGTPRNGLTSVATLTGPGSTARYTGQIKIDDSGDYGLSGRLDVDVAQTKAALLQLGQSPNLALSGPATGAIQIERKAGRLALQSDRFTISNATLGGKILVEKAVTGAYRMAGDLKLDRVSLPDLFTFLTSQQTVPTAAAAIAATGGAGRGNWSEQPVDLSVLDALAGSKLRLEISNLALTRDLGVTEARLDAIAKAGGLDLRLIEGQALGGRATGLLSLDKAPAGAKLQLEGRLNGARFEAIGGSRQAGAIAGGFSLAIKGQGTALTPRGLIVALAGQGDLALQSASLNRWNPAAVGAAAEAVVSQPGELAANALRQQLELGLAKGGRFPLGSPRVALTLADGALRSAPLTVQSPSGAIFGQGMVDLDAQTFNGQLRIEAKAPPPTLRPVPPGLPKSLVLPAVAYKPDLPAIVIGLAGPLSRLTSSEPQLDITALEREVAVRKVEREVVELERVRRIDEEVARLNAERLAEQQRLDEQRRVENERRAGAGLPPLPDAPAAQPAGEPAALQAAPPPAGQPLNQAQPVPPEANAAGTAPTPVNGTTIPANPAQPTAADEVKPAAPQAGQRTSAPKRRPRRDPFDSLRNQGGG